jgi:CxxC-x17-CxxC domain-containing protein
MDFVDRILKCSDCGNDFIFTAGEQLFFFDRQFKNDPKRCKLCKAKRAGLGRTVDGSPAAATLPLSRTETRTECSACGVETTVPFKPTQGRPVFCRSCFQVKRVPAAVARVAGLDSPADSALAEMGTIDALNSIGAHGSMAAVTLETIAETPAAALNVADVGGAGLERMAAEAAQA